jgi:hypothetical protein
MSAEDIQRFLPKYPNEGDEKFSYNLAAHKEFYDLKLTPEDETVGKKRGELLMSQKIIQRFMSGSTPYAKMILYHQPGTGKTCAASSVVENFASIPAGPFNRMPALILVKNDDLKRNFIQEVAYTCTDKTYIPELTKKELLEGVDMSEEAKIKRLNRAISRAYQIETYETFLKNISSDRYSEYNNRVIIVDEAHNFRAFSKPKQKKKGGVDMYWVLHSFLHVVQNSRIILSTGTPLWDVAEEFASIMNLLLNEDEQLPLGSKFIQNYFSGDALRPDKEKELERLIAGKISYLRVSETSAKKEYMGVTQPFTKYVKIFPDIMSKEQTDTSKKAKKDKKKSTTKPEGDAAEDEQGKTKDEQDIWRSARDAASCIYPVFDAAGKITGYEYGQEAFIKNCVKSRGTEKTYGFKDPRVVNEFKNNLGKYSTKFASIIYHLKKYPNEVAIIIEEFVEGAGAILLSLILELHGFSRIKKVTPGQNKNIPSIPKRKDNFATITANPWTTSEATQIQALLNETNKSGNKYGEHLRVIIGSGKFALGFSVKNVRQIHDEKGFWHMRYLTQANARGMRAGSHNDLPPTERYVRIYRHAAVYGTTSGNPLPANNYFSVEGLAASTEESIDLYVYHHAEDKELKVAALSRLMKRVSFDCPLAYKRNVLASDADGSTECDYTQCNYECVGFPPSKKSGKVWLYDIPNKKIQRNNYYLYYSGVNQQKYGRDLIELFSSYFSLKVQDMERLLSIEKSERPVLMAAVDDIISRRIPIRDRYGISRYLKEDGDMYFLDGSPELGVRYDAVTYSQNPYIAVYSGMETYIQSMETETDVKIMDIFCTSKNIHDFEKMSHGSKVRVIEEAYAYNATHPKLNKHQKGVVNAILDAYDRELYEVGDNTVHVLYSEEEKGTKYSAIVKKLEPSGKMRIFDDSKKKWCTVSDPAIEKQYIAEIKKEVRERIDAPFEDNPYGIYGTLSRDGEFRVMIEQPGAKSRIRGRSCKTYDKQDLMNIFIERIHEKGGKLPPGTKYYKSADKTELVKLILGTLTFQKYTEKELKKMELAHLKSLVYLLSLNTNDLCEHLKTWLEKQNLLFELK